MGPVEAHPLYVPEFQSEIYSPKLNVVMVSESSLEHASGVTTSVKKVADHLLHEGHEVTIICPGPAPDSFGEAEVIATKSVRLKGFDAGHKSTKKFKDLLSSLDPDVVHIASPMRTPNGVLFLGGNAISAANKLDIPITAVYQTDAVRFAGHLGLSLTSSAIKKQIRKMHNKADLNLVPSSASEQDLMDWGVHPESIVRWGRGVDTKLFNTDRRNSDEVARLREQWAPNGETIIGLVSRLEPEKLIHKLAILKDIPNTRMVIVGQGTQSEDLAKQLGENATFTGRLNGEDLANAYAAIDIFPFPSTSDTFAQVIQEAKASGIPVVAANRGGPRDLVNHGENGFLYEPAGKRGQDTGLRSYVQLLVEDPARRMRMGESARASVENRTWSVLGREIVAHYRHSIDLRQDHVAIAVKSEQLVLAR